MTERERKAHTRRTIGRGWLRNSLYSIPRCIAYLENGDICGKPAEFLDPQRGGMVCNQHKPK